MLAHHEGGFVDHSNDPGGATNFGVSLRFLRQEGIDIDGDGDVDINDIRALTAAKSRDIYKEKFWIPCKCAQIRSTIIAAKVFDMAVNMGQRQAFKLVQRAVNALQYEHDLVVDGLVGVKTIDALNDLETKDHELIDAIREEQADFYENLIHNKPELADFRLGWLRRATA